MPFFPLLPVAQTKLEELQGTHNGEVARLHRQIDELDNQIIRMQMAKRWASLKIVLYIFQFFFSSLPDQTGDPTTEYNFSQHFYQKKPTFFLPCLGLKLPMF